MHVPERIGSKVAVLVYKVLHGCASSYLGPFTYVADLPSLPAADCLVQPPVHRSTVGSRAFSVAGTPGVELSATRGYVGVISDSLL